MTNTLIVGTTKDFGSAGANNVGNVIITGSGATLQVTNGNLFVRQGGGTAGSHRAVLDLSGLDTFKANVDRIGIGYLIAGSIGNGIQREAGLLYLAKTNYITVLSPHITVLWLVGIPTPPMRMPTRGFISVKPM